MEAKKLYKQCREREFLPENDTSPLYKEVRILCWVMTNPTNHWQKAQYARRTWGQRCNIFLFMSTVEGMLRGRVILLQITLTVFFLDPVLGTIALPCEEGRDHLWCKVRAAFKYVYEHHLNEADFFLKADDDSYMIVENLRYLLEGYTGDDPVHFGSKFLLPNRHDQVSCKGGSASFRNNIKQILGLYVGWIGLCSD